MPMVVLGFALLFYLSALGFGVSFVPLLIAHTVIGIPYLLRTVIGVYRSLPPDFEEAAAILGARPLADLIHITLPLIRAGRLRRRSVRVPRLDRQPADLVLLRHAVHQHAAGRHAELYPEPVRSVDRGDQHRADGARAGRTAGGRPYLWSAPARGAVMSSTIISNLVKSSTPKDSKVTAGTAELVLDGISKSFGGTMVLQPLRLTVPGGALVALLGPSGCGKTTTLRIIAGFERADTGRVTVGGTDITSLPPNRRRLGMVFQNYSLFPHMTIADNVAFGLKMAGCPKSEIGERVTQALATVRLAGMDARYPNQLSGGQQQRVALARSLVTNPKVLLLDEPLGALDKNLRESMQFELRQLQQTLGITTVLVTHDQEEALTMSDQVAVMRDGRLIQFGPPSDVYHRPMSRFVAEFLGASNVIEVAKLRHAGGRLEARLLRGGATIEASTAGACCSCRAFADRRAAREHIGFMGATVGDQQLCRRGHRPCLPRHSSRGAGRAVAGGAGVARLCATARCSAGAIRCRQRDLVALAAGRRRGAGRGAGDRGASRGGCRCAPTKRQRQRRLV